MITRGELKGKILRLLMKTAEFKGFYTDDSINDAIEEALDLVATEMFLAGEGWQTKIEYLSTVANQMVINLPPHMSMIQEIRYKFGDVYIPLIYDDGSGERQYDPNSGARQWASVYRLVDNALYFNPPLAEGGDNYLMIEYMSYPKRMLSDADFMESHFDYSMQHFIKYRAASILASRIERFANPWTGLERDWFLRMQAIVIKRNAQTTRIKEFCD